MHVKIMLFFFAFFFLHLASAQETGLSTENKRALKLYNQAHEYYKKREFNNALKAYRNALKVAPDFVEVYLRIAGLFAKVAKIDSVYDNYEKYLQRVETTPNISVLRFMIQKKIEKGKYLETEALIHQLYQQDTVYRKNDNIQLIDQSIAFALKQLANPVKDMAIEKLPAPFNRYFNQYLPAVTVDNTEFIYTIRKHNSADEDIYMSKNKGGKWQTPISVSTNINTPLNEGAATISADGNTMIYTSCDKRDSYGGCDLYITKKINGIWIKSQNIGRPVNSRAWESQPSLSADGKTLYFSSNKSGGYGQRDIWVTHLIDDNWGEPVNLGTSINTKYEETTPFIHANGETLYFSSNGFVGMGGYDLLRSKKINDTLWSDPVNLGYPINTHHDEIGILIAADGKTAYYTKETTNGNGESLGWLVTFQLPESLVSNPVFYLAGKVIDHKTKQNLEANVEVIDLEKKETLFSSRSDPDSGSFLMVLPAKKEILCYVKKKGYFFYSQNISIQHNLNVDTLTIELLPVEKGASIVLRNIYFDLNAYELTPKSEPELNTVFHILEENETMEVSIEGHTDDLGTEEYNEKLSKNRAKTVYQRLISMGINRNRMSYKGYGSSRPLINNTSGESRQQNRRIEFKVQEM